MTDQQKADAVSMLRAGLSLRSVADHLGVPQWDVARAWNVRRKT